MLTKALLLQSTSTAGMLSYAYDQSSYSPAGWATELQFNNQSYYVYNATHQIQVSVGDVLNINVTCFTSGGPTHADRISGYLSVISQQGTSLTSHSMYKQSTAVYTTSFTIEQVPASIMICIS